MPRIMAPPPSGEFQIRVAKPFSGNPSHTIEVIGEPNRPAVVRVTNHKGESTDEKTGDVPKDDVNELTQLVNSVRGFPSHPSKDVYGLDTKLELNTFEIQWASDDDDNATDEVGGETKDDFKRVVDSIEALARQFAKNDSAI
ncbi:hypothetical protein TI39_contig633g00007 [Zymoseptoria brevis]|uniref:Uncharacterized protein n=1 Tax=Zymoseptoria brevis TaxID=1047168 RepID=A0A0F4GH93_9PEZI|nr:hypothetical protein TI39_contig633g00007 [Zymoseptoria brevis]